MSPGAVDRPHKDQDILIIAKGFGADRHWTTHSEDLTVAGFATPFISIPELEYNPPANVSGLNEGMAMLDLPVISTEELIMAYTENTRVPPITIIGGELVSHEGDPDTIRYLHAGRVKDSETNPDNVQGMLRLHIASPKSKLKVQTGILNNPLCEANLGDGICQLSMVPYDEIATMSSFEGRVATLTGFSRANDNLYWARGRVAGFGDTRNIVAALGNNKYLLDRAPLTKWLSVGLSIRPGCDKTQTTCEDTFDNIEHHTAPGRTTPSYNPTFEDGAVKL